MISRSGSTRFWREPGYNDRVALSPSIFVRFANTFLRVVWRNNVLAATVPGELVWGRKDCAGWIPLAQFDPWVWTRARDTLAALPDYAHG